MAGKKKAKDNSSSMAEAIKELIEERGLSPEAVKLAVENMLKAAYKRAHGTNENAVVTFEEDETGIPTDVTLYSRKEVVDGVYDPVMEIELERFPQESSRATRASMKATRTTFTTNTRTRLAESSSAISSASATERFTLTLEKSKACFPSSTSLRAKNTKRANASAPWSLRLQSLQAEYS